MKIPNSKIKIPNSQNGQAAITAVIFLLGIFLTATLGFSSLALKQANFSRTSIDGKKSYFLSEAGQEDAVYRLRTARAISSQEVISLSGGVATTSIAETAEGDQEVTSISEVARNIRSLFVLLTTNDEAQFNYGVHVGEGGLMMKNSSSIRGNVYSNGSIIANNKNVIRGTAVSAGPSGLIEEIHATSSVRAHTIRDSFIEGDAFYQEIENTTVLGTLNPGSDDAATSTLAISDEQVEEWKEAAEAGSVIFCDEEEEDYKIKHDTTLGPAKISCDLIISGSPVVTVSGAIWVEGNIEIRNSSEVRVDPSLGNRSVPIIADDPSDRIQGSTIRVKNTSLFSGSGEDNSYVLLLSQNEASEQGISGSAIEVSNNSAGDLLVYSGHGEIELTNSIFLREVSAYSVRLRNTAEVVYEAGLANLFFDSGPSGGFSILDWKEIE